MPGDCSEAPARWARRVGLPPSTAADGWPRVFRRAHSRWRAISRWPQAPSATSSCARRVWWVEPGRRPTIWSSCRRPVDHQRVYPQSQRFRFRQLSPVQRRWGLSRGWWRQSRFSRRSIRLEAHSRIDLPDGGNPQSGERSARQRGTSGSGFRWCRFHGSRGRWAGWLGCLGFGQHQLDREPEWRDQ